jgi:rhodanese-related sulfurtransferase
MMAFAFFGCQQQTSPLPTTLDSADTGKPQPAIVDLAEQNDAPKVNSKEFIIDVRSQEEWESGHLNDAVWIPHTEITERISEVTEDKSAKLVLY